MPTIREVLRNVRLLLAPRAVDEELNDELRAHIEMQTELHIARGMTAADARAKAERDFGPIASVKEALHSVHSIPSAPIRDSLGGDLHFALRSLARHRAFSAVTVLVLTLGIAATTLMFSVVSGILLRPLPFAHPEQVVLIWGSYPQLNLGFSEQPIDGLLVNTLRERRRVFSSISAFEPRLYNLGNTTSPERLNGVKVTSEFFSTIGVRPALGRAFVAAEETPGRDHVVVVSWALWKQRFGGDPRVIGTTITLNAEPYTIIGVGPEGFAFPRGAEMPGDFQMPEATQLWIPMKPPVGGPSELAGIGRVRPGVTLAQAQADLDHMSRIQDDLFPQGRGWWNTRAIPLRTQVVGDVKPMLFSLFGAAAVLLMIACVNAAQLLLARLQSRRHELAIRAALGASTSRIARVLLLEAMLITGIAGVLGTVAGAFGISLLRTLGPSRLPRLADITFDWRVTIVAIVVTLFAGVLFGLAPAMRASRIHLADALRQGGRKTAGDALSVTLRRALVGAEVALSVMLAIGSGLLVRSLTHELGGDLGFSAPHGLTFEVTLPPLHYPEKQLPTSMLHPKSVAFIGDALARIGVIPGVKAVAIGKPLPMSGAQESTVFTPDADADPRLTANNAKPIVEYTVASPGLFAALGTPLLEGRDFSATDQEHSHAVVIVNRSMAQWLWPGKDPIGRRVHLGTQKMATWMTVVGVTADMKRYSLTEGPRPEMFVPYTQDPYPTFSTMQFVVRSSGDPTRLVAAIRRAVASVDPDIPLARIRTIDELVSDASANARFATLVMSSFGVMALALAMIGLYGVIAFMVHQRRQEFGLRTALGATREQLVQMVLVDGFMLACVGMVAGVVLALVAGRLLRSMLYQVSVADPLTLVAVVLLLLGTTALACVLPAVRASGVDPRAALDAG
ncbi:MAG TPA: ABC transporter permease [Gemmatimonadaceae bacterium]|nr:ABC transporter permease [Gemmatimonadaceae bacterium]